jgi:hypothetical protein
MKAFEAERSPRYDVAGFSQCICTALALPEDKERFLAGLRRAGIPV